MVRKYKKSMTRRGSKPEVHCHRGVVAVGEPVLVRADADRLDGVAGPDECVVDVVARLDVLPPPERGFRLRPPLEVVDGLQPSISRYCFL